MSNFPKNRKFTLASLPILLLVYALHSYGFDGIQHWFGFLSHKAGEGIEKALPDRVNIERLRYEIGRFSKLDKELVEEIASVSVKKRKAESDLVPFRSRLEEKVRDFDYVEGMLSSCDPAERAEYEAHKQKLVSQISVITRLVTAKESTIKAFSSTLERLKSARETAEQRRDEFQALIADAESQALLKKASPSSAYNDKSMFAPAEAIAEKILAEMEKSRMEMEVMHEKSVLFETPSAAPNSDSIVGRARRLLHQSSVE